MGGRIICCCEPIVWSKVIAWLQIIGNILGLIVVSLALTLGSNVSEIDMDGKSIKGTVLAVLILSLVMRILGIIFGAFLWIGTLQRRPAYLSAWIFFTVFLLVWSVVETLFGNGAIGFRILQCFICILVYGFGIWVVHLLKDEIRTGAVGAEF